MSDTSNGNGTTKFLVLALSALLGLFAVTYSLLLDRISKQETIAATDITALREEIKTTKADAKDSVSAAVLASKDAVAATASALRDSVAATALASKDAVNATAIALKDSGSATATALSEKIETLSRRIDKLEDRSIAAALIRKNLVKDAGGE